MFMTEYGFNALIKINKNLENCLYFTDVYDYYKNYKNYNASYYLYYT
jgi:hypothetical protein